MPTPDEIRKQLQSRGVPDAQIEKYIESRLPKTAIESGASIRQTENAGLGQFRISDFYSGGAYSIDASTSNPHLTPEQQKVINVTQKISNTTGQNSWLDNFQIGDTLLGDAIEGAWNVVPQTLKGIAALPSFAYQTSITGIASRIVRNGIDLTPLNQIPLVGMPTFGKIKGANEYTEDINKQIKAEYDKAINKKKAGQQLSDKELSFVEKVEGGKLDIGKLRDPWSDAWKAVDVYTDKALTYINANSVKPNETTNEWAFGIGNGLAQVTAVIATGGAAAGTRVAALAPRAMSFLNTYGSVLESAKSQGIDYEDAVIMSGTLSGVMSAWDMSIGAEKMGLDKIILTRSGKKAMSEVIDRSLTDAIESGVTSATMSAAAKQTAMKQIFTQRLKEFAVKGALPETIDEYLQGVTENTAYMLYNLASDADAAKYDAPKSAMEFFAKPLMEGAIGGITGGAVNIYAGGKADQYQIVAQDVLKGMVATSGAATKNMDIAAPVYNLIRADVISGGRNKTAQQFRDAINTSFNSGNYGDVNSAETKQFAEQGLAMISNMEKVAGITKAHNLKPEQAFDLYQMRQMEREADATIAMYHDRMINDAENDHDVTLLKESDDYKKALLVKEIVGGQVIDDKKTLNNDKNVAVNGVSKTNDGKLTVAYTNKKGVTGLLANAGAKGIVVSPKQIVDLVNNEYNKRYMAQQEAEVEIQEALQAGDLTSDVIDKGSDWAKPVLQPISDTNFQTEFEVLQQIHDNLNEMNGRNFPTIGGDNTNAVDPKSFSDEAKAYQAVYESVSGKVNAAIKALTKNKRQYQTLLKKNPNLGAKIESLQNTLAALQPPTAFEEKAMQADAFAQPEVQPTAQVEQPNPAQAQIQELNDGDKIQWDVYGGEESGEWTVGQRVKTRGGKDAVILSKVYVESSSDGKSYTQEYADKNGIKYDNTRVTEHIVPIDELTTQPAVEEVAPMAEEQPIAEVVAPVEQPITKAKKSTTVKDTPIESLKGRSVRYKNSVGTLNISEGGMIEIETEDSIIELGSVSDFPTAGSAGITSFYVNSGDGKYNVSDITESSAVVNGVPYTIVSDNRGVITGLQTASGQVITNEPLLIAVEIERNKVDVLSESQPSLEQTAQRAVNEISEAAVIDGIYRLNYSETIDSGLEKLYDGKELSDAELLQCELWVFDALDRVQALTKQNPSNEIYQSAFDGLLLINELLHKSKPISNEVRNVVKNTVSEPAEAVKRESERIKQSDPTATKAEVKPTEAKRTRKEAAKTTWIDAFEKAKQSGDIDAIEILYDKIKVVQNGVIQGRIKDPVLLEKTIVELNELKKQIEDYASEWNNANKPEPAKPTEAKRTRKEAAKTTWENRVKHAKNWFQPTNMFDLVAFHILNGGKVRKQDVERYLGDSKKYKTEFRSMSFIIGSAEAYDVILDSYVDEFPELFPTGKVETEQIDEFFSVLASGDGSGVVIRSVIGALNHVERSIKAGAESSQDEQQKRVVIGMLPVEEMENISDEEAFTDEGGNVDEKGLTAYREAMQKVTDKDVLYVVEMFEQFGYIDENGDIDFEKIDTTELLNNAWFVTDQGAIEQLKQFVEDGKAQQRSVRMDNAVSNVNQEGIGGEENEQSGSLISNTGTGEVSPIVNDNPETPVEGTGSEVTPTGQDGGANVTPAGNVEQQAQGGVGEAVVGKLEQQLNDEIAAANSELSKLEKDIVGFKKKRKDQLAKQVKADTEQDMFNAKPTDLFNEAADLSKQNLDRINKQVEQELALMIAKRDKLSQKIDNLESSRETVRANDAGQQEMFVAETPQPTSQIAPLNAKISEQQAIINSLFQTAYAQASRSNPKATVEQLSAIAEQSLAENEAYNTAQDEIARLEAELAPIVNKETVAANIPAYTDAILNGEITAEYAVDQITGVGLDVPNEIQELADREANGENVVIGGKNDPNFRLESVATERQTQRKKTQAAAAMAKLQKIWPSIPISTDMNEFVDVLIMAGYGDILSGDTPPTAFAYKGKIYLNPAAIDAATPIEEVTHVLNKIIKEQFPALYYSGVDKIKGTAYEKNIRTRYKAVLDKMRSEGASEEQVNAYVYEEALAQAVADKGAKIATSLQPRFTSWLKKVWAKISEFLNAKTEGLIDIDPEELRTMSFDAFMSAYANAVLGNTADFKAVLTGDIKSDIANFHIIGERGAKRADAKQNIENRTYNLRLARQLEEEGQSKEVIKYSTGWERGIDNKWRYEIQPIEYKNERKFSEYNMKGMMNPIPIEMSMVDGEVVPSKAMAERVKTVGDFFDADDLFAAYPHIKSMPIIPKMGGGGDIASFTPIMNSGAITYSANYPFSNIKSAIIHEIQHAIQAHEGFAFGGDKSFFRDKVVDANQKLAKEIASVANDLFNQLPEELKNDARNVNRNDDPDGTSLQRIQDNPTAKAIWANYVMARRQVDEILALPPNQVAQTAYDQYFTLAGEVEARNAQKRALLSPEQRRTALASTEDVSRKDQHIMYMYDAINSLSPTVDEPQFHISPTAPEHSWEADPDLIPSGTRTAEFSGDAINDYVDTLIGTNGNYNNATFVERKMTQDLTPFVHATIENKTKGYFEGLEMWSDPTVRRDIAELLLDEDYESPNDTVVDINGKTIPNPYRKIAAALFGQSEQVKDMASVENIFSAWNDWRDKNIVLFTDGTEYVIGGKDEAERLMKGRELSKDSVDRYNSMKGGLMGILHQFGFKYTANGKQRNINLANFMMDVMNTHTRAIAYFKEGTLGRKIFSQEVYASIERAAPVVEQGSKDMQRVVENRAIRKMTVHHGINSWDSVEKAEVEAYVTTPDGSMEVRGITLSLSEMVQAVLTRRTQLASYGEASMDAETSTGVLSGLAYDEKMNDGSSRRVYIRFDEGQRNNLESIISGNPDLVEFMNTIDEVFNEQTRTDSLDSLVRQIHGRALKTVTDDTGSAAYFRIQTVDDGGTGLERLESGERSYDEISQIQARKGKPKTVLLEDALVAYDRYRRKTDDFLQYALPIRNMQNFERATKEQLNYQYQTIGAGNVSEAFWTATTRWQDATRDYSKYSTGQEVSKIAKFFEGLTKNVVLSKFAFNAGIVMKQTFTYFSGLGLGVVKNQYLLQEMAAFVVPQMAIALPASVRGKDIANSQSRLQAISNYSTSIEEIGNNPHAAVVYNRIVGRYTADTEIYDNVRQLSSVKPTRAAQQVLYATRSVLDNYGMSAMVRMDRVTIVAQYRAAKRQATAEGLTGDDLDRRTAELATELMYKTNVMSSVGDRTHLQLSRSTFEKMLGIFTGQSQKMTNTVMQSWFDMRDSGSYTGAEATVFYKSFANMILINAMGMAIINSLMRMLRDLIYKDEKTRKKEDAEYFTMRQIGTDFVANLTGYRPAISTQTVAMITSRLDKSPWKEGAANFIGVEYYEKIFEGTVNVAIDLSDAIRGDLTAKERTKMYNTAIKTSLDFTEAMGIMPSELKRTLDTVLKQKPSPKPR